MLVRTSTSFVQKLLRNSISTLTQSLHTAKLSLHPCYTESLEESHYRVRRELQSEINSLQKEYDTLKQKNHEFEQKLCSARALLSIFHNKYQKELPTLFSKDQLNCLNAHLNEQLKHRTDEHTLLKSKLAEQLDGKILFHRSTIKKIESLEKKLNELPNKVKSAKAELEKILVNLKDSLKKNKSELDNLTLNLEKIKKKDTSHVDFLNPDEDREIAKRFGI